MLCVEEGGTEDEMSEMEEGWRGECGGGGKDIMKGGERGNELVVMVVVDAENEKRM